MKILFVGSVEFSKNALEKLISMGENIVGVVCKESSKFNDDFADLGSIASNNNVPFLYTKNINSEEVENWIKSKNPDVIYCFGWSQIIKRDILNIPRFGVVGYHPAKLPYNKGRHPLIWALFLGLQKTASSFFFMDEDADTGDIIDQKEIDITMDDDARTLYNKMTQVALKQMEEFTKSIKNNNCKRIPQEITIGNTWRKRGYSDGKIDWRMSTYAIYNLVRALTKPYVGAHITIDNKDYKIWKLETIERDHEFSNIEPGRVLKKDYKNNTFDVKTYDGIVRIVNHDIENLNIIGDYLL